VKLIFQPNSKGCFAACCATLFGGEYEEWDCVGHHHPDWREKLREKTGLDFFEVSANEHTTFSLNEGDIYILGILNPFGSGHVVLGRCTNFTQGNPCEFEIFHDPLGEVKGPYKINAVIVLSKIFRMP
jgi:hypothetical protein